MSEAVPIHEWVLPRVVALVRDAETAGFDRATVVAVITDIITSPAFNEAPLDPEDTD